MSRGRFEKEPMSASQWTGLHCILRRYAASAMGVEGMEKEKERETARPKERLQSVPGNWEAKGGRNLFDSFVPRRAR